MIRSPIPAKSQSLSLPNLLLVLSDMPPNPRTVTDPSALVSLAESIGCTVALESAERLLAYLDAMLDENTRINLTAVRDRESAVLFHALDSLAMAGCSLESPPKSALDLGTGNGFPGVAIACLYSDVKVWLMDRKLKKLNAVLRALEAAKFDLAQFEAIQMDAAEGPAHGLAAKFDLITTRAVGGPVDMGRMSAPLLAPGGNLLTWLSEGTDAPETLKSRMRRKELRNYTLPEPASRERRLAHYTLTAGR